MLHSLTDECTLYSTHSLAYMSVYRVHSPMSMHTCTTINRHAHVSLKERLGHKLWRKGRVEGFFPIAGHAVGQSNACTLVMFANWPVVKGPYQERMPGILAAIHC